MGTSGEVSLSPPAAPSLGLSGLFPSSRFLLLSPFFLTPSLPHHLFGCGLAWHRAPPPPVTPLHGGLTFAPSTPLRPLGHLPCSRGRPCGEQGPDPVSPPSASVIRAHRARPSHLLLGWWELGPFLPLDLLTPRAGPSISLKPTSWIRDLRFLTGLEKQFGSGDLLSRCRVCSSTLPLQLAH